METRLLVSFAVTVAFWFFAVSSFMLTSLLRALVSLTTYTGGGEPLWGLVGSIAPFVFTVIAAVMTVVFLRSLLSGSDRGRGTPPA